MTKDEEKAMQDDHRCLMFDDKKTNAIGAVLYLAICAVVCAFVYWAIRQ